MAFGARLAQRFSIGIAAAALLIYIIVMLWPYLVATLVRGSAITAWTHLATAPIQGRAPAVFPPLGAQVAADGVIMEITNDLLDPATVRVAEANLTNAAARVAAADDYLRAVQALDQQRRELMGRYALDYRADLDAEIDAREARVALLEAKTASAVAISGRSKNISDGGYRSRDYHDDSKIRVAEAEADLTSWRRPAP